MKYQCNCFFLPQNTIIPYLVNLSLSGLEQCQVYCTFKGVGRNYRIAKCTAANCALRAIKKQSGNVASGTAGQRSHQMASIQSWIMAGWGASISYRYVCICHQVRMNLPISDYFYILYALYSHTLNRQPRWIGFHILGQYRVTVYIN